jgi:hypothetical protein
MNLTTEFWVQIVVYAVSFGSFAGTILTKLKYMEKKLEEHNKIVERMYCAELKIDKAFTILDELKERVRNNAE